MSVRLASVAAAVALALTACSQPETGTAAEPQNTAKTAIDVNALADQYFEDNLKLNPCMGVYIGDYRFNDQYCVQSPAHFQAQRDLTARYLAKLAKIDAKALSQDQHTTYELLSFDLNLAKDGERFPNEELPLNQFYNDFASFAQLGSGTSAQPFATVADYDAFLKKVAGFSENAGFEMAAMKAGMAKGVVLPKILAKRLVEQLSAVLADNPEDSLFWGPVKQMPAGFSDADKARLTAAYKAAIATQILPAYQQMRDFIRDQYLPACRDSDGWSGLPDGKAWYDWEIRSQTTQTEMSSDQIHQLGLQLVDQIHGEMAKVQKELGIKGDLHDLFHFMQTDPSEYFKTPEEALQAFRDVKAKVYAKLPTLFDTMPKSDYEIRATEKFRAANSAAGEYQPGTPDGSRKGVFYANIYNLSVQPKYGVTTLSLHEAAPGHHFQISLQMEQSGQSKYRQFTGYNAYVEGWALYSETLGKNMGLYQDPNQYYGHLSDALLRAMRLVVDTGLHAKGWSHDQAIAYMRANSSMSIDDIRSEVERYMALPGQALGYMLGRREIEKLRDEAKAELGDKFDIRAFHHQVLGIGAVPLEVLAEHIHSWIKSQKA
ncbi:DUF885 domain-containing protein [Gallaecimonas kandeliae]|uniref:DUF885 domain-containing protein n=1 Tax=Gallaecimonas kandeliae TaxID=3029055 RepID=UPI002649B63E|nr:DUF885 domain-containing protein [Gallaecimonas kandeliae]WKE65625.1 DUF885 domain-containing protein [Gallaecimonas kandeliae]